MSAALWQRIKVGELDLDHRLAMAPMTRSRSTADIEKGLADVITVGAMTLANPDLVERIKLSAPLNTPDPTTFYGGGAKGYTDYPVLTPEVRR